MFINKISIGIEVFSYTNAIIYPSEAFFNEHPI